MKRELKEELNLDVKVGGLFAKTTFEYPDFVITLSVYECEMLSSFVLKEHESYRWMPPAELKAEDGRLRTRIWWNPSSGSSENNSWRISF